MVVRTALTESGKARPPLQLTECEGFQSHQDYEGHHDENKFCANDPDSPDVRVLRVEPEDSVEDEDGHDEALAQMSISFRSV